MGLVRRLILNYRREIEKTVGAFRMGAFPGGDKITQPNDTPNLVGLVPGLHDEDK